LNGFAFWNVVLLVYMVASYGYPIIQFFILETYGTPPWSI
jgi:cytochrome c oxidase subunit 1